MAQRAGGPAARWQSALATWAAGLNPGAGAFVMATGIVSTALRPAAPGASAALLLAALAGYGVLLPAYGWRLLRRRDRFTADLTGPHGFAFLTVVAAAEVLSKRLALDGRITAATAFLWFGAAGWLVLGYGIPLALIATARRRPSIDQVNGTWFLWTVATQSVVVAAAAEAGRLSAGGPAYSARAAAAVALAAGCWGIGLLQYLLTAATALARLLVRPVAPAELIPPYWVFMGAAAITVVAGAELLLLPPAGRLLPPPAIAAACLVLWSFCSWLIPLLLALGVWRHLLRRVPLRYEAGWWSLVFPVGMYGVASRELGRATGIRWLTALGAGEAGVAAAVWGAVFAAMLLAVARGAHRAGRYPGR